MRIIINISNDLVKFSKEIFWFSLDVYPQKRVFLKLSYKWEEIQNQNDVEEIIGNGWYKEMLLVLVGLDLDGFYLKINICKKVIYIYKKIKANGVSFEERLIGECHYVVEEDIRKIKMSVWYQIFSLQRCAAESMIKNQQYLWRRLFLQEVAHGYKASV